MKDITNSISIVYGGLAKATFDCNCGKEIRVSAGGTYLCDCGKEYCVGVRVYEVDK